MEFLTIIIFDEVKVLRRGENFSFFFEMKLAIRVFINF